MIQSTEILCAKNDYIFKLVFGDEKNKDVLAGFINAVTKIPLEDLENLEIVNLDINTIRIAAEMEGKERGMRKGIMEGMRKGVMKGKMEGKMEITKNMILQDLSFDVIAKTTNYPVSEIERIAKSMNN